MARAEFSIDTTKLEAEIDAAVQAHLAKLRQARWLAWFFAGVGFFSAISGTFTTGVTYARMQITDDVFARARESLQRAAQHEQETAALEQQAREILKQAHGSCGPRNQSLETGRDAI